MNYENRIVTFIDILVFASIIKNTVDDEPFITELYRVFERIRFLMGVSEPSDDVAESRRVSQFSDSIFISFNFEDETKEFKYLSHFTLQILKGMTQNSFYTFFIRLILKSSAIKAQYLELIEIICIQRKLWYPLSSNNTPSPPSFPA
jgi:hypothetical protein